MVAALSNHQIAAVNSVNQPMFPVDPTRPPAGIVTTQRFRLAGALKRVSLAFGNQAVYLCQRHFIPLLPKDILIKRIFQEEYVHSSAIASSCAKVFTIPASPDFQDRMALSNAALLAGLAVR